MKRSAYWFLTEWIPLDLSLFHGSIKPNGASLTTAKLPLFLTMRAHYSSKFKTISKEIFFPPTFALNIKKSSVLLTGANWELWYILNRMNSQKNKTIFYI